MWLFELQIQNLNVERKSSLKYVPKKIRILPSATMEEQFYASVWNVKRGEQEEDFFHYSYLLRRTYLVLLTPRSTCLIRQNSRYFMQNNQVQTKG